MNLTEEKFKNLLAIQKEFDSRVVLVNNKSTKVAYLVEFIEWINTLEFFKDWKQKKGKSLEVQLGELADLLAFGLSLGIQNGVDAIVLTSSQNSYVSPHDWINTDDILAMISELSSELYNHEFDEYYLILLPLMIGEKFYSTDQLIEAYFMKMSVNHERQDTGY